jgi:tetratricopeptide (TPR) repeat protein
MPGNTEALALGLQYHQAGYLPQAEQIYCQVLQTDSANADALAYLGELYMAQGRFPEAATAFQQVLRLRPHFAEMYSNLGITSAQQGQLDEAVANFQQALALKPDYPEAHNNLAIVLVQREQLDEAIRHYGEALRLRPDYAEAHNNLGIALARQKKLSEAMASYRQALRLRSDYAEAHNNLGAALETLGQLQDAVASYGQAVRLKPNYVEAHNNLGASLDSLRHLEDALSSYGQAVWLKPDYADAHRNRALLWLLLGDFEQGWPEYEWRWRCQGITMPPFRQPLWDGSPLEGRTVLLHAEQGLGDTLQFIRYAPLVQQQGGKVLVQCQPPLLSVLARCAGIDHLVGQNSALPDFDVHAPLLSLPGLLRTALATIPAQIPYLSADASLVEHWRAQLDSLSAQGEGEESGTFRIGIAWQGNPQHKKDRQRSLPLASFEPLARLPGVQLFSLQAGPGTEQLAEIRDHFPVIDLGSRFNLESFEDAAAVVKGLDLILSVDSAIVHLAGALGRTTWTLLPFAADWRWLLGREDSPWYPTMRLFRQKVPGDWDGVFERIVSLLSNRLEKSA